MPGNRKKASRTSPETEDILQPKSVKKVAVKEFMELEISTTTTTTIFKYPGSKNPGG